MAKIKPKVKLPKSAAAGETITIKTLIKHPMESGQRKDKEGKPIPRKIINKFVARFNDEMVMEMVVEPAVSANPYIEFEAVVQESGTFHFAWTDDDGSVYEASQDIAVS